MEDGHVGPYPPPKGDKTHATQVSRHTYMQSYFFFYSVPSRLHDKFAPSL